MSEDSLLLISEGIDPLLSVAVDEVLLERTPVVPLVHLYRRSAPTVSLGYSRPLSEVDVDYCRSHGIAIVRRVSGGGTIYSGLQQWQLALVIPNDDGERPDVDLTLQGHLVVLAKALADALGPVGNQLRVIPPNDLYLDRGKVAGAALRLTRSAQLLHATIADGPFDD